MKKQLKKLLNNTHFSKDLELCFFINTAGSNYGAGAINHTNRNSNFGKSQLLSQETDSCVDNAQQSYQLSKEVKDEIISGLDDGITYNGIYPDDTQAIKALQKALNIMGYCVGTPDGIYTKKMVTAIEAFQQRVNYVLSQKDSGLRVKIFNEFDNEGFRREELPVNGRLLRNTLDHVNTLNPENEEWKVFGNSKTLFVLSNHLETNELKN